MRFFRVSIFFIQKSKINKRNSEINEINEILFLEGKDEYSEQKDTDYAEFIKV